VVIHELIHACGMDEHDNTGMHDRQVPGKG
jgi:hypothetical protein